MDTRKTLDKAVQLAEIASDWHLDEVEIDGEMVSIYDLRDEFKAALEATPAMPQPDWSNAPEWATHHLYSCLGQGLWTNAAHEVDDTWYSGWRLLHRDPMEKMAMYSGYRLPIGVDWRTTLTARPAADTNDSEGG